MIIWLLIGLAAGSIAKHLTPQNEKGGWVSSIIVGIVGSIVGGILGGILGLNNMMSGTWLGDKAGDLIIATGGAVLVLWIYHKYLADKLNLPI